MIDGCSRCDVDEACVFLLKHLRDRRTRNRIAGAQIRAQHLLQELGIFFPELCAAGKGSDRVNHDVKASVLRDKSLNEALHRNFVADVDLLPL